MRAQRPRRRTAGAAMVEFALVAPLLLTLLLGVVELGWVVYSDHFVASAARQAARYAIVRGAECTTFASACPASSDDIQTYVRSLVPAVLNANDVTASATWTPDNTPGSQVKVTVQYTWSLNIPFAPPAVLTLQSESEMVIWQ